MIKLLRSSCLSCHMIIAPALQKNYFNARMRLLEYNLLNKIYLVDELYFRICESSGDNERLLEKTTYADEFRRLVEQIQADESGSLSQEPNRNVCEVTVFLLLFFLFHFLNFQFKYSTNFPFLFLIKAKIQVVKEFMELSLKTGHQTCPHCNERLCQLRAEMNSKIFVKRATAGMISTFSGKIKKSSQPMGSNTSKQKAQQVMMRNADETSDAEVPDDMEKAMDGEVIEMDDDQQNEDDNGQTLAEENESNLKDSGRSASLSDQIYLTPVEIQKHLRLLVENERETLIHLLGKSVNEETLSNENIFEMFFFECVPVPPSRFRPISTLKDQKFENARTTQLSKLIQDNMVLKETLTEILNDEKGSLDEENALAKKIQNQAVIESISSKLIFHLFIYFYMVIRLF